MQGPKDIHKISGLENPNEFFAILERKMPILSMVSFLKVFVLDDVGKDYVLKRDITREEISSGVTEDIKLKSQDPLITHLLDVKRAVLAREIDENIAVALTENRRTFLTTLKKRLIELKAEVCLPGFIRSKLVSIFILGKKISQDEFSSEEIKLFSELSRQCAKVIERFNSIKRQAELFVDSIRKINNALEAKDVYTRGHSGRVAQFSVIVGKKLRDELEKIPFGEISLYYAAEFHDIGKINLPDNVLKKEGKLNDEEWEEIKRHPLESAKIIEPLKKWFGKTIVEGVLYHHENYDGTGYPYGKKADQINILARIIRVADSFDAMITDRPYRRALSHHEVISELKKDRGKKFGPKVTDAFLEAYREGLFKEIFFSQLESEVKNKRTLG